MRAVKKQNPNFSVLIRPAAGWLFGLLLFCLAGPAMAAEIGPPLNQQQVADLARPAVVRIVNRITGQVAVPPFEVDLASLEPVLLSGQNTPHPIDTELSGSGFIVGSGGYIATNSHVVASSSAEDEAISEIWLQALSQKLANLSQDQRDQIRAALNDKFGNLSDSQLTDLGARIIQSLKAKSVFSLTDSLTVLNPSSTAADLDALVKAGFPAQVVSYDPDFNQSQRDVALIKINQTGLPTLGLSGSDGAAPGSAISVFSYPSTATFNDRDFLTPSFTQGVISAVKDSGNGFKIFQTDAKISTGSSGGPLLNAAGQVVGIITFETGDAGSGQGDNFAFALPVELIKQMMDASGVSNDTNNFYDAFARGLLLQNGRHCRQAIAEFQQAGTANAAFIAPAKLDSRIGDCQASIDAGLSLDTPWDAFRNWLAMVPVWLWLLAAGGLLLLLILAVIIFRQSRWLQKEDLEIKQLEREVESSRSEAAGGFTMPVPRPSEAGLREYVAAARARGLAEPIIAAELRQAGFSEQKISEELSVK